LPGQAEIICDHDAALNLVKADLLSGKSPEGKYVFYAMRYDQERPSAQPYNYLMWLDPVEVCFTFEKWLSLHLQARRLITNRTHSAILGSILGIPTVLLPNNYHKNRSVWEFSLQDRGVQWRDHLACRGMNALIESNKFLRQGFSSPNYKRVLKLRLNYLGF
jgi:exopolysaccharide biosynthesis predicted pyruvyltransferase EpsI